MDVNLHILVNPDQAEVKQRVNVCSEEQSILNGVIISPRLRQQVSSLQDIHHFASCYQTSIPIVPEERLSEWPLSTTPSD